MQTCLGPVVHNREDAGLFSATTVIMLPLGYLLYIKYLICIISFNIIITLQGRSYLHLIDEKNEPQRDGGSFAINPGLEPEASKSLFVGLYTCLRTGKPSYPNKTWTDMSNSLLFSRISAWSLTLKLISIWTTIHLHFSNIREPETILSHSGGSCAFDLKDP